jgi:oligopeptide/dipeptide ABC transporter ATP-binding protein
MEAPTAGELRFRGENLSALSEAQFRPYRAKMQIVFQDPFDSMNPRWTVGHVIEELLRLHTRLDAAARQRRIDELLTLVGLAPGVKTLAPRQLSAGRQQRVAIARAIATDPDFVVLDEPTSALTPETTAEIIQLLMALSRRLGIAYLFISHDLTTVEYICHRVAVMYLGQIVELGPAADVLARPAHPYTRLLLDSVPAIGRPLDRGAAIVDTELPSNRRLPAGCFFRDRCPFVVDGCERPQSLAPFSGPTADNHLARCHRAADFVEDIA